MDETQEERFVFLMKRLGRIFDRAVSKDLLDDYKLALRDIEPEQIERAIDVGQKSWQRFPKPAEIRQVSERISQHREKRRTPGDCVYSCSEAGLIVVDAEGNPPKSDYIGHTYCKPCPIHRPAGVPAPGPEYVKPADRVGQAEAERINLYRKQIKPAPKVRGWKSIKGTKLPFDSTQSGN